MICKRTLAATLIQLFSIAGLCLSWSAPAEVLAQDRPVQSSNPDGDDDGGPELPPQLVNQPHRDTTTTAEHIGKAIWSSAPFWLVGIYMLIGTVGVFLAMRWGGAMSGSGATWKWLVGIVIFTGISAFVIWSTARVMNELGVESLPEALQIAVLFATLILVHSVMFFVWFRTALANSEGNAVRLTITAMIGWTVAAVISAVLSYSLIVMSIMLG